VITAVNLYKNFGEVAALKGVTFSAGDGMVTGLLGPNGAGKTTTLRILYTLLDPDAGYAQVDGYNTQEDRLEVQRRIGALPDSHGLYPRLTARENIRYYGRLKGMSGSKLENSIDYLIKILDMKEIEHRKTEGFSSGQRVKVAIARALVHEPKNVLLDEPSTGLDVMSTRAMRTFILRLKDEGKCVLFSSHIMQEVSALCENIYIINRGEVVACGSPEHLLVSLQEDSLEEAFVSAIDSEDVNCDE
jgi:sodium transport system ATP-binding protein